MHQVQRSLVVLITLAALALSACQGSVEEAAESSDEVARVEPVEGTGLSRVILTAKAAERLGIRTAEVREAAGARVIPYSAIVYDPDGDTWAYANPEPLTFLRQSITVERIEGDAVFLLDGPSPGTSVVTVGAAELYGTELGIE